MRLMLLLNPLPEMADRYVSALKDFGSQYRAVYQVDACGVRLAPGLAVVPGLNNGLAVFVTAMEQDQERRLGEIRLLAKEVQKLYTKGSYLGVIVGDDFNFEPDDPVRGHLRAAS